MGIHMETIRTTLVSGEDLPTEFVRVNWVSAQARDKWDPIFRACSSLFTILEKEAVRAGIKKATIQTVHPSELEIITHNWMRDDFMVVPLEKVQATNTYQSSGGTCDINKPWNYKVAIGRYTDMREIAYLYKENNTYKIGDLLGYPDCCIEFFEKTWVNEKWIDTSLPMALGTTDVLDWSPFCNILLRWMGLRLVSHLPCSFHCVDTMAIGRSYMQLAYDLGHRTTIEALHDILSWPVEWSGLHGIGLITTPVCRVEVRTDMLDSKHTVKLHSDKKPDTKQSGLTFPLQHIRNPNANGFYSETAQRDAHNLILDIMRSAKSLERVIDLGCGDSTLLHKVADEFGCKTVGVDVDAGKQPDIVADIFNADYLKGDYSLALISKARIRENKEGWHFLLSMLAEYCDQLVIYSYNGDIRDIEIGPYILMCGIMDAKTTAQLYALTTA